MFQDSMIDLINYKIKKKKKRNKCILFLHKWKAFITWIGHIYYQPMTHKLNRKRFQKSMINKYVSKIEIC